MTTIGNVPYFATRPTSPAMGRAWNIIGRTLEGEAYCPRCVHNWDEITLSRPIFASDEAEGLTCATCGEAI
jgi:hypothetical protein